MNITITSVDCLALVALIGWAGLAYLKGREAFFLIANLDSWWQEKRLNDTQRHLLRAALAHIREHHADAHPVVTPNSVTFVFSTGLEYTLRRGIGRHTIKYNKKFTPVPRHYEPDADSVVDFYNDRRFSESMQAGIPCPGNSEREEEPTHVSHPAGQVDQVDN